MGESGFFGVPTVGQGLCPRSTQAGRRSVSDVEHEWRRSERKKRPQLHMSVSNPVQREDSMTANFRYALWVMALNF